MKRLVLALSLLTALACSKKVRHFESKVKIERFDIVRKDEKGTPLDGDVEFQYPDCPGEQIEVIRGGAEFTACMSKYKVGAEVPVKIEQRYLPAGFWDWDVVEMGGCKRPPDPEDEASFDTVQECEDIVVNGVKEGFVCDRLPKKKLLEKCPWFARN